MWCFKGIGIAACFRIKMSEMRQGHIPRLVKIVSKRKLAYSVPEIGRGERLEIKNGLSGEVELSLDTRYKVEFDGLHLYFLRPQ